MYQAAVWQDVNFEGIYVVIPLDESICIRLPKSVVYKVSSISIIHKSAECSIFEDIFCEDMIWAGINQNIPDLSVIGSNDVTGSIRCQWRK
ncbi:hypothetical protein MANI_028847 [Metarhizium anisopliae]|nr:hypothetical protein MANI_028847 [Metarhizium anisopliae]